jgi:hypothetical protein
MLAHFSEVLLLAFLSFLTQNLLQKPRSGVRTTLSLCRTVKNTFTSLYHKPCLCPSKIRMHTIWSNHLIQMTTFDFTVKWRAQNFFHTLTNFDVSFIMHFVVGVKDSLSEGYAGLYLIRVCLYSSLLPSWWFHSALQYTCNFSRRSFQFSFFKNEGTAFD